MSTIPGGGGETPSPAPPPVSRKRKSRWRSLGATAIFLIPVVAVVVYSSFQVSRWECELCMRFHGGEVCRTVTGATRSEAYRTGVDNACAHLASGVTDTIRCSNTAPVSSSCRELGS